jgi:hypothetical protein
VVGCDRPAAGPVGVVVGGLSFHLIPRLDQRLVAVWWLVVGVAGWNAIAPIRCGWAWHAVGS